MVILIIILFVSVSFLSFQNFKQNDIKLLFFLIVTLLFLLDAFRPKQFDRDYLTYLNMYDDINNIAFYKVELSFALIAKTVKTIFNQPLFLFIIYAFLGVTLKCIAIKQLSNFLLLSLLIYISNFYLLHELTQIRAGVATGFMLIAIKPMFERNLKLFLLYALLAFLFHYSAILIFFLWFLPIRNINYWIYALLIPVAYILYFCNISFTALSELIPFEVMQNKIYHYKIFTEKNNLQINVFNVQHLSRCCLSFLFLWMFPLLKYCNKYVPILLQLYIWGTAAFIFFSDLPVFAFRISELLLCVEIILVPCIYYIIKQKQIAVIIICGLGLGVFLINIFHTKLFIF